MLVPSGWAAPHLHLAHSVPPMDVTKQPSHTSPAHTRWEDPSSLAPCPNPWPDKSGFLQVLPAPVCRTNCNLSFDSSTGYTCVGRHFRRHSHTLCCRQQQGPLKTRVLLSPGIGLPITGVCLLLNSRHPPSVPPLFVKNPPYLPHGSFKSESIWWQHILLPILAESAQ